MQNELYIVRIRLFRSFQELTINNEELTMCRGIRTKVCPVRRPRGPVIAQGAPVCK